jgi:hypothetical protein
MMLFAKRIQFWTTLITLTTARLPTPCIHGETEPGSSSPNNPKCGVDHWCKRYETIPPGAGANGTKGFCEEFTPTCKPGEKVSCGINGICNSRGHCELNIPDTTVCETKYPYVCGPGSRGCGKVFSMCNRCGYCVPTPESMLELDRGQRCEPRGTLFNLYCQLGKVCNEEGFCIKRV